MKPRTLILRTAGTNCDRETAYAFERAGADVEFIHLNRVVAQPSLMDDFQLLALPGGFSYGDDIAAGRIFANQIRHHLADAFRRFMDAGKPIIGICNGFQVLVKTDLLPGSIGGRTGQTATLAHNDCGRFIDKWIHLGAPSSRCIWTAGLSGIIDLPIAHGEGKFVPGDQTVRKLLWDDGQVALVYSRPDGQRANSDTDYDADYNPNGSIDDIAGICDSTGLVFGLMPHPERFVDPIQHPAWTSRRQTSEGQGLAIFRNAIQHVTNAVGAGV